MNAVSLALGVLLLVVAVLDEALTLFRFGIPERERPDELALTTAR